MKNIKEERAYYTLITQDTVYRNCSWKFANDNAVLGDKLITINNGLLHHVRTRMEVVEGKFTSYQWEQLYEDRDWIDMERFR